MFDKGILLIVLPWGFGYVLSKILFQGIRLSRTFELALSFGLGYGLVSQWMLWLGIFKQPFSGWLVNGYFFMAAPFFFVFMIFPEGGSLGTVRHSAARQREQMGRVQHLVVVVCAVFVLYHLSYAFWRAMIIPVYVWDAIGTASLKAKIFFFEQKLVPLSDLPHATYPLQVPLLETWTAMNAGVWDDQQFKIIFPMFLAAFLGIHYYTLRVLTNRTWAAIGTALVVSSVQLVTFSSVAYREIVMIYYNCSVVYLLILWMVIRKDAFLRLAGFFAGFVLFTKSEGLGYAIIYALILFGILCFVRPNQQMRRWKAALIFLIPCLLGYLPFFFYKRFSLPAADENIRWDFSMESANRVVPILQAFGKYLFLEGNWNLIWFVLLLSLLRLLWKKPDPRTNILLTALGLSFCFYFILGLTTGHFIGIGGKETDMDLSRLILQFFPLAPALIVLLNSPQKED